MTYIEVNDERISVEMLSVVSLDTMFSFAFAFRPDSPN